ncbi:MAG TPA: YciI family protein [Planctomycetia bacterium]|nr:YciI family protein [Planctomycetia bacterium]
MRFMMLVMPKSFEWGRVEKDPDAMPDAELAAAMMKYNDELAKAGVLLGLEGLHSPASAARVTFKNGKATVTDGPFAEAKEVLGGYWMIKVNSREEAIAWARRIPGTENEMVEVRQVREIDEFPEDVQKAHGGLDEIKAALARNAKG